MRIIEKDENLGRYLETIKRKQMRILIVKRNSYKNTKSFPTPRLYKNLSMFSASAYIV